MEELMERGVHAAVFRVFMALDTRSLRNAACVCRSWRRYERTKEYNTVDKYECMRTMCLSKVPVPVVQKEV